MATEKRFVVLVEACNGSSGLTWSTVVLDTSDGARAIRTAREVEKLGYKIDWESEDRVIVLCLEPEKVYPEVPSSARITRSIEVPSSTRSARALP